VPLYQESPAPIGLADLGLSQGTGGSLVTSVLNTSSLRGTVDPNATGIQPYEPGDSSPYAFSIQLNAVLTNVDLSGATSAPSGSLNGTPFEFWTQNVVEYYPALRTMVLVTNVWNFSGSSALGSAIYEHGPHGQVLSGEVYEASLTVPSHVVYPFNLTLFLNSTLNGGRDEVEFAVDLVGPGESFHEPYDFVIFNSVPPSGQAARSPAVFTADGTQYDPAGLTNDFELDLGGPGDGTQSDLLAADATMGLAYWDTTANAGAGGYESIPSAFNFGDDTGETASGANVAWSDAPGGPAGLSTYGTMTTGPTLLSGLWNAGGPEGSYRVTIDSSPSNAFELFAPTVASVWPDLPAEAAIGPTVMASTFWLAPGEYALTTELSDFDPVVTNLNVTGPGPLSIAPVLSADASQGIYTPLWAWSNHQIAALSTSGEGTPTQPYVLENSQLSPIGPTFGQYNDYGNPVYPGILFLGTTASTEIVNPPPFTTLTNESEPGASSLPESNHPQFLFQGVSGVALVDATVPGGWFADLATLNEEAPVVFDSSVGNLVANSTFAGRGNTGLMLVGGRNNTIWGNTFEISGSAPGMIIVGGTGLFLGESGDLVYNNAFVPGLSVPYASDGGAPYFGVDASAPWPYEDRWNVTPEPASYPNFAPGFPTIPLAGSILGISWQGGNYWWDYGLFLDPYGVVPFKENLDGTDWIGVGGDYAPITPLPLWKVTLTVGGGAGDPWQLTVANSTALLSGIINFVLDRISTAATTVTIYLPNGSFPFLLGPPSGFTWSSGTIDPTGNLTVDGENLTESVVFALGPTYTLTLTENGLPSGTELPPEWCVELSVDVVCSTASTIRFLDLTATSQFQGTYSYTIPGSGYHPSFVVADGVHVPSSGGFEVPHTSVAVWFGSLATLTFAYAGPPAELWSVSLSGLNGSSPGAQSIAFTVPLGLTYRYTATVADEPAVVPFSGSVTFSASGMSVTVLWYSVTFTETSLPLGTNWSVAFGSATNSSTTGVLGLFAGNGTYVYRVVTPVGFNLGPTTGTVVVAGANISVPLTSYAVTFNESGLPAGVVWSVTFDGATFVNTTLSSSGTIVFYVRNGTYAFDVAMAAGYGVSPTSGIVVVNGGDRTVRIESYAVAFCEVGLPGGLDWSVTLNGRTLANTTLGSSGMIVFYVVNGTYRYKVAIESGYGASPTSGKVLVSGTDRTVLVKSSAVTFSESGLPDGVHWSVTLDGRLLSNTTYGSTGTVVFYVGNGTYFYTVPGGGSLHYAGGTPRKVVAVGGPVRVTLTFEHPHRTVVLYGPVAAPRPWVAGPGWATRSRSAAGVACPG
jgi:thermopsin